MMAAGETARLRSEGLPVVLLVVAVEDLEVLWRPRSRSRLGTFCASLRRRFPLWKEAGRIRQVIICVDFENMKLKFGLWLAIVGERLQYSQDAPRNLARS